MGGLQVSGMQVGLVSKYDYMAAEMQIDLELSLSVGDRIHIIGVYTDFIQRVESMKHGGWPAKKGRAAQKVRVPAKYHVRAGDAMPQRVSRPGTHHRHDPSYEQSLDPASHTWRDGP